MLAVLLVPAVALELELQRQNRHECDFPQKSAQQKTSDLRNDGADLGLVVPRRMHTVRSAWIFRGAFTGFDPHDRQSLAIWLLADCMHCLAV